MLTRVARYLAVGSLLSIFFVPATAFAAFTALPTSGIAPLTVQFSNTVSGSLPGPVTIDYGDGSSEPIAGCMGSAVILDGCGEPGINTHTYNSAGSYTAKLISTAYTCQGATIGAPSGCPVQTIFGTATTTVVARSTTPTSTPAPTCTLTVSATSVPLGNTTNLRWSSTNSQGGAITSIGSVGPSGTQGVIPTGSGTTYVGTFTGTNGRTATCSVRITTVSGGGFIYDSSTNTYYNPTTNTTVQGSGSVTGDAGAQSSGRGGVSLTGGLVPCGATSGDAGNSEIYMSATQCNLCSFGKLIQNLINYMLALAVPISVMLFAYVGVLYFGSAANPAGIEKAKGIFKTTLIGLAVAVSAFFIVSILLTTLLKPGVFSRDANGNINWSGWAGAVTGQTNYCDSLDNNRDLRPRDKTVSSIFAPWMTTPPSVTNTSQISVGGGVPPAGGSPTNTVDVSVVCTTATGKCSDTEARTAITQSNLPVSVGAGVSFANVNQATVQQILNLDASCNAATTGGCGGITVTSVTDGSHAASDTSHTNGFKVDIGFNNTNLNNYIQSLTPLPVRSDGAAQWQDASGNIYAKEITQGSGPHWDIKVIAAGPVKR